MVEQNTIPEYLTKDFSELELRIVDALMTYTKNRTQRPSTLYYKALCNAAQQIFVQLEESVIAESFEDDEGDAGDYRDVIFDMREFPQMGIASYIEAEMLEQKIADALIKAEPCWGEKIAIKYGYFETDFDEKLAIRNLMHHVYSHSTPASEFTDMDTFDTFGRIMKETLDEKMKGQYSWKEEDAVEFFRHLKGMQPAWADTYNWHIASIDLYEWFCLKNNLIFHQFRELYDIVSDDGESPLYRLGAYALRYPSESNMTLIILSALQKYAREHPDNPHLKFMTEEDTLFMDDNLKPVEELAILGFESDKHRDELEWHYRLRDRVKGLVNWKLEDYSIIRDTAEFRRLYDIVSRCLGEWPALIHTGRDGTPEFDESTEKPFCWNDDDGSNEYCRKNFAWIVRTTLEPFCDCMKPGTDFDKLCDDLAERLDSRLMKLISHWTLYDELKTGLSNAFEEKLAEKLAYDIFVRQVKEEYHHSKSEEFRLRVAVARDFAVNGPEYKPELCRIDDGVNARLQKVFAGHPLIANQLLARIQQTAAAVNRIDSLCSIPHHYFLAEKIRDLFDAARESVWIGGDRIQRQHGVMEKVYATYGSLVDELYRETCRHFSVQPCVDISRVM